VRVNLTLTEPDGTTTKVNEPGLELDADVRAALADVLVRRPPAPAGSPCPLAAARRPVDWYAELTDRLRATGAKVAPRHLRRAAARRLEDGRCPT
jgi:1-phosphofructokinase